MTYTAPDGHIIDSLPYPQVVTYTCACDLPEGIYESQETTSAATPIGIQQINITRTVVAGSMTIEIVMSSDQELQDYINANKP